MDEGPGGERAISVPRRTDRLNDAQRRAVEFGARVEGGRGKLAGPLLIIAGAGSGKTNTLAHRVAHLIECGADPGRILLLTFSTRAADEMSRRVQRICAQTAATRTDSSPAIAWAGTFHGVGARLLREFAPRIGLDPAFTIHDREDSADLMNIVRHEAGAGEKGSRFPLKGTCLAIYSSAVNTCRPLHEVLAREFPWCAQWEKELQAMFLAYVRAKQAQNVLDFDDLLLYWAQMLAESAIAAELGARFDHLLVDEYQDTNSLQARILLAIKPDGTGLAVVGDDAQSIYSFRGATVRNILDFPACFEPPAARITLDRNYRSTQPILAAANSVIAQASERYTKDLWTERASKEMPRLVAVRDEADQAGFVVEQVLERRERGLRLQSQAVLFRTVHHSARLELELTRRDIPYVKFGGLKFLEAAHVKDVIAILRWTQNPRDRVSGFRALQLLEGVGPRTAARVLGRVQDGGGRLAGVLAQERASAPASLGEFLALVANIETGGVSWPSSFERVCVWYESQLERLFEDSAVRAADVQQLARIASTYPSRERFLTELTLDPPEASSDESGVPLLDEDYLILSTIHSAKGREWNAVTLLQVVDGCIPSDLATGSSAQIEEERRLLYVAMTRARDHLDLVIPQRFHVSGQMGYGARHVYATRTRFIPDAILANFEHVAWPRQPAQLAESSKEPPSAIDLGARMRAMWE